MEKIEGERWNTLDSRKVDCISRNFVMATTLSRRSRRSAPTRNLCKSVARPRSLRTARVALETSKRRKSIILRKGPCPFHRSCRRRRRHRRMLTSELPSRPTSKKILITNFKYYVIFFFSFIYLFSFLYLFV